MNFALTCPMRGSRAFVTFPKLLLLMSPLGLVNCVWLKMLKNSPRISKDMASLNGNDLRYSETGVVEARTVEESAIRCPETSAIRTGQNTRH